MRSSSIYTHTYIYLYTLCKACFAWSMASSPFYLSFTHTQIRTRSNQLRCSTWLKFFSYDSNTLLTFSTPHCHKSAQKQMKPKWYARTVMLCPSNKKQLNSTLYWFSFYSKRQRYKFLPNWKKKSLAHCTVAGFHLWYCCCYIFFVYFNSVLFVAK